MLFGFTLFKRAKSASERQRDWHGCWSGAFNLLGVGLLETELVGFYQFSSFRDRGFSDLWNGTQQNALWKPFCFAIRCNRFILKGLLMSEPQHFYPLERRPGEIERLHAQGDALIADTSIMLDRIGVAPGWRCLDLGCGPRGITDLLSTRVGPTGRVVGLDADLVFLDHARHHSNSRGFVNVEFVTSDVFRTGLPAGSFDLVHTRFVASSVGNAERLLEECVRLTRPGGCVAFQDADMSTLNCYPSHPAWESLKRAFTEVFPHIAGKPWSGHDLYRMVRQAGLEDVQYRPFLVGFRSSEPMADYLPATMESVRSALLEKRLIANELDAAIAECRAHLAAPGTVSTYHTVVQVWGTKRVT